MQKVKHDFQVANQENIVWKCLHDTEWLGKSCDWSISLVSIHKAARLISGAQTTHLRTVNTLAIFPIARILLRITSFLLMASLCSSSSSPSSSSSVQILRMFTSISVTESRDAVNNFPLIIHITQRDRQGYLQS